MKRRGRGGRAIPLLRFYNLTSAKEYRQTDRSTVQKIVAQLISSYTFYASAKGNFLVCNASLWVHN